MIRQIYKGRMLTRTVVKNNILKIHNLCEDEDKIDWYAIAHEFAIELKKEIKARSCRQALGKACGVIAALSPVKRWEQNKVCSIDMVRTGDCGHMAGFKDKAKRILASNGTDDEILSILNGRKISAFYLNIMYPHLTNVVTIDRHALSISLGHMVEDKEYQGMTKNQYEFFVQCYAMAAVEIGITSVMMQSSTWLRWRKIKNNY